MAMHTHDARQKLPKGKKLNGKSVGDEMPEVKNADDFDLFLPSGGKERVK